jgi:hypothetical protein
MLSSGKRIGAPTWLNVFGVPIVIGLIRALFFLDRGRIAGHPRRMARRTTAPPIAMMAQDAFKPGAVRRRTG